MFYHLITSNFCNLNCYYCSEKAFHEPDYFPEPIESMDNKITYDLKDLVDFISKDKDPTITLYGGEPLLNVKYIREVMDALPNVRYMIQTNGLLLHLLEEKYISKFHTILVSIDGNKEITDKYRGKGVYDKVLKNIRIIRERGFKGELIARMTIEEQNIYESVMHLLGLGVFDSIHWQLDANFWQNDWKERNFRKFALENYIPNLKRLGNFWIKEMEKGKVLKLYPFLGIAQSILYNEKARLRCGSGFANYTIQTNGKITPCPVMIGMYRYYAGDLKRGITKEVEVLPERCKKCKYLDLCGGRCLYSNIVNPWPEEEVKYVCLTVAALIDFVKEKMPKIKKLIDQNIITKEDFQYLKYNGTEIIP